MLRVSAALCLSLPLLVGACAREAAPPVWPGPGAEAAEEAKAETPAFLAEIGDAPAGPMDPAEATAQAPATFRVRLATTRGDVVIEVRRAWSPRGADRFFNLVKLGFFTDVACFRVIHGFMAQFGIHGNPAVSEAWNEATIPDDEAGESNRRGTLSFATAGPGTRTTQLFINYRDNLALDDMGFTPIGLVVSGMEVVDELQGVYGEGAPEGKGPSQGRIAAEGNRYLKADFPRLDYIRSAEILP